MPAAESPRPAAGVRVVETTLAPQRPQPPAQFIDTRQGGSLPPPGQPPQPERPAPPPRAGLSIRGARPGEETSANIVQSDRPAQPAQPAAQPGQAPATGQPPAAGQAQADGKPDTAGGDDASARFSLLELD
jgi:hypothetical protein